MLECHVPDVGPHGVVGELISRLSVCLDGELGVEAAARLLEGAHLNAAPVVDDNGVVVGLVTAKSLDRARLEDAQLQGFQRGHTAEVEDAMTRELFTVSEKQNFAQVLWPEAAWPPARACHLPAQPAFVACASLDSTLSAVRRAHRRA